MQVSLEEVVINLLPIEYMSGEARNQFIKASSELHARNCSKKNKIKNMLLQLIVTPDFVLPSLWQKHQVLIALMASKSLLAAVLERFY